MMPPPAAASVRGRRPVRVWDIVVTIVLLILLAGLTADRLDLRPVPRRWPRTRAGCATATPDLIAVGMLFAAVMPWVLLGVGGHRL